MNVTTSVNWKRSPVGIVRVEQELLWALTKLVGARLRQIVFEHGDFVLRRADGDGGRGDEEFWPHASAAGSVDPFDPIKTAPPAKGEAAPSSLRPQFRSGDVLITVGLDWEIPGLHERLRHESQRSGISVITCCYDLIPIQFPQYCVGDVASWFKDYLIRMSWSSDAILCISDNTKKDYVQFADKIGLPERRTDVIKLGSSISDSAHGPISDIVEEILQEPYFLFVSTIERRKNHAVLYRAYHLLRMDHPDLPLPKLVFVGMHGWGVDELLSDIRLDPLTQDDILFLNHVSDAELAALYKDCEAFLFPSFYEGWGLPVAEALQFGRPVLASAAGSIPEVGGDLVRYIDPWSPRDWADELLSIATGKTDMESWSKKISAEFKPYEWNSAAMQILGLIREIRNDRDERRTFAPGYDLSTLNGIHYGDKIIFTGSEGVVCHGPYLALDAGEYRARFSLTHISSKGGDLRLLIKCDGGKLIIVKRVYDFSELETGLFEVDLDFKLSTYSRDIEFVVEVVSTSAVRISIDNIEFWNLDQ